VPFLNKVLEMVSFCLQTHIKCHELILIACSADEAERFLSDFFSVSFIAIQPILTATQVLFVKQGSHSLIPFILSPRTLCKEHLELFVI
jgi:hypothetical protein